MPEDARVADALAVLEAGGRLPPDEKERGRPREPAAKFMARMDALRAIYEAQYRKGGMRTACPLTGQCHGQCSSQKAGRGSVDPAA